MTDNEIITALRARAQSLEFNLRWLVLECVRRLEIKTPQTSTAMSEWISVKERLPGFGTSVLVCDAKNGFVGVFRIEKRPHDEIFWHDGDTWWLRTEEVTHWMPIPEPPVATDTNVGHKEG